MPILTPTDFSEIACRAAEVAGVMAVKRGTSLRLVHSLSSWISSSEAPATGGLDELAEQQLAAEADRLRVSGVLVEPNLRHGSPGREVAAAVGEVAVELIVIGSGDPADGHHLAGSVAEKVAEGVPVPTLVVRRPEPLLEWLEGNRPLRALCAVELAPSSDAAMRELKGWQQWGALHIEVVHFARLGVEMADVGGAPHSGDAAALQREVGRRVHDVLGDRAVPVHLRPDAGHAPEALARLADEWKIDLLVVGTRQIHGLRRLVAPSFSRGVLTQASVNILCVPQA